MTTLRSSHAAASAGASGSTRTASDFAGRARTQSGAESAERGSSRPSLQMGVP